jgi:hypothetical protein
MYKFRLRYVFIVMIAVCMLTTVLFWVWANSAQGPAPEAVSAMQSGDGVRITSDRWLVFEPENRTVNTGFIFYPGGRIEPRSYAPFARDIAAQGYLVVIVPMPLNLAVFGTAAALEVIDVYSEIEHWAVGGHSLGGVAAASFVYDTRGIQGLVLWASYPQGGSDLSARADLVVASVYGTNDTATVGGIEQARALLPATTTYTVIEGGNHAQFGWYGEQVGDGEAGVNHEAQQEQTVSATLAVLNHIAQR